MSENRNGNSGGANTNLNGLQWEKQNSVENFFQQSDYSVVEYTDTNGNKINNVKRVFKNGELEYTHMIKTGFSNWMLSEHSTRVSKLGKGRGKYHEDGVLCHSLEPDEAVFSHKTNTLHVFECKFQSGAGSVHEKITTCDFKQWLYHKCLDEHQIKLTYTYVLSPYFKERDCSDEFEYISKVGGKYVFGLEKDEVLESIAK